MTAIRSAVPGIVGGVAIAILARFDVQVMAPVAAS